jgi:hypothetical protein
MKEAIENNHGSGENYEQETLLQEIRNGEIVNLNSGILRKAGYIKMKVQIAKYDGAPTHMFYAKEGEKVLFVNETNEYGRFSVLGNEVVVRKTTLENLFKPYEVDEKLFAEAVPL